MQEIYPFVEVQLTDFLGQTVATSLKIRETDTQRFFRTYFTPLIPGRHTLSITYKGIHISCSPFYFYVPAKAELNDNHVLQLIKPHASRPCDEPRSQIDSTETENRKYSPAGRGRLLQKKLNDRMPVSVSSPFSSQKRKSPSFDVNNNRVNNYAMDSSDAFRDGDVQELSSKLKKVSVDESANTVHNLSEGCVSMDFCVEAEKVPSRVSDHLRKHARSNGLETMPNLKAKLVCKYSNLKFPIGVRVFYFQKRFN